MKSFLKEANSSEIDIIVSLLAEMQNELKELELNPESVFHSIAEAMKENVHWFLFVDEDNKIFGTCYLQSVHNYWQVEKRYYLGGFYIKPSHRAKGRFRELNQLLKQWAVDHNGVQIYCHIHQDNQKSLASFGAIEIRPTEYKLCVNHWGK
jgi:RimJ/RimL family protein N-acetyltransferase